MRKVLAFATLLIAAVSFSAAAEESSSLYRWVDDEGNVHYTDSVPAKHADEGRTQLNAQGFVIDSVEAAPTPAERRAARRRAKAAARAKRMRQARQRQKRVLLTSYANVAAIKKARQARIEALESRIQAYRTTLETRRARMHSLVGRAADKQRAGLAVTENLKSAMAHTRSEMSELRASIEATRDHQAEVREKFAERAALFRKLTREEG